MAIVDFTNPDACKWFASYLRKLCEMGVDVLLVQTRGDEAYLRLDPESRCSQLYAVPGGEPFPEDFSLQKLRQEMRETNALPDVRPAVSAGSAAADTSAVRFRCSSSCSDKAQDS